MNKVVKLTKKSASGEGSQPTEASVTPLPSDTAPDGRPPYDGSLSTEEVLKPGGNLLGMLAARANQLGMKLADMCKYELDVTYGYFHQMRSGMRHTKNISDEFATRCALFLGVPRLTVLVAAGCIPVEDYFDQPKMAAQEIFRAIEFIMKDPQYGVDMMPEVLNLSLNTQFAIVQLYEKATGKKLIDGSITMESLVSQLALLDEVVAKLRSELPPAKESVPALTE